MIRVLVWMAVWLAVPGLASAAEEFPAVVEAEVRAVLSAEREGVLTRLGVDAGDRVDRGGEIAEVFHRNLVLQKELREANRDYLRVQLENLERLRGRGMTTDEELARVRMELAVNDKEIRIVETDIGRSVIRSPFPGVVVTRISQPHEWVRPGDPVVELYDPRRLRFVADIPADIAVNLETGDVHEFFFPALQTELRGTLRVFVPQVDVRSNTVKIYWEVERRPERLIPGMKGVLKLGSESE